MIYLRDYLDPSYVVFLEETDKESALNRLVHCIASSPNIEDKEALRKAVFNREKIISTGIGLGIAIPHVKIKEVKKLTICIGIGKKGIDWDAIDNKSVYSIFLIAGPAEQHELYLKILSKIVLVLKKRERREKMLEAEKADEVLKLFKNL